MKESMKILRIRGSKFEIHIGAKVKIKVRAKEYWRRLSREKSERKEEKREIYNSRYRCNRALD